MTKIKKISLLVLGILIITLSFTGISYAMWQVNNAQTGDNIVNVGCFETSTDLGTNTENSAISLDNHFPISDVEGMKLTPFTFTITNTCTTIASFQVNLETMSTSTISNQFIKVAVNNNKSILNTLDSVETTLANASSSNMLESGSLYPGQSITLDIRLWVDEATTIEDLGADDPNNNLTYAAKVTLATSAKMSSNNAVDYLMQLVSGEANNTLNVITKEAPDGATCTNTLGYDNTTDNNLRYVGENPCNYVYFNCSTTDVSQMSSSTCEIWRIIGIMNNIDDGTGKKETRIKIVRTNLLGNYSWDTATGSANATEEDPVVNDGRGINQWGPSINYLNNTAYPGADLMRELNSDYLDLTLTANTNWYNGQNNQLTGVFDYTKRLNESSQSMIDNAVWYTGAANDTKINSSNVNDILTKEVYINERNNNPHSLEHGKYCPREGIYCTDSIERTYNWTGKVGLIYPSDFAYATSGSINMSEYTREKCINDVIIGQNGYNSDTYGKCGASSWLKSIDGWTISPRGRGDYATGIYYIQSNNYIHNNWPYNSYKVHPSVYLKQSVKLSGGNGSLESPYTLSID